MVRAGNRFAGAVSAAIACRATASPLRIWLAAVVLTFTGCTHVALRNNTVNQAWTVADVCQQQVLNNLAMFVFDPGSLPHFSYPNSSGSNVTDQGNMSATPGATPSSLGTVLFNGSFGLGGFRQSFESFVLTPITDPRKLELMRCAYQQAVARCRGGEMSTTCPDCETRLKVFYTGKEDGKIETVAGGRVTSGCINQACWFGVACDRCLPKNRRGLYIGEYCGVYVVVPKGGRDELAKLTLAILDYALNNPPQTVTKQVAYFVDHLGLPTTPDTAVGVVAANIGVDETNESLLNSESDKEAELRKQLVGMIADLKKERDDQLANLKKLPPVGEESTAARERLGQIHERLDRLQMQKRYLDRQVEVGPLEREYVLQRASATGGQGTQQLQQILQFLAPQNPGSVGAPAR